MKYQRTGIGLAWILLAVAGLAAAQDIEPRRWTPLPTGMNVFGAAIVHTEGDIGFDPVLQIENATVDNKTVIVSYLRAFALLGKTARFDARLPYMNTRWEGLLGGEAASAEREGPGDPRLRLSVNFFGAPALTGKAYQVYRTSHPVHTTAGAALAVTLPFGEYKKDKLLNLGGNRFVFRPQLGIVHSRYQWSYELTGSVFLYGDNDDFYGNNKREQDPLYALQAHLVYTSSRHAWISLGAAHDWGGESSINGDKKDDERRDLLYGISAGLPLGAHSSVKLAYVGRRSSEDVGQDTDSIVFAYSYRN